MVIAKFLLQVVGVATSKLHQLTFSHCDEDATFLQQELSHLLLFIIYMFQSGRYYKVRSLELCGRKSSYQVLWFLLNMPKLLNRIPSTYTLHVLP